MANSVSPDGRRSHAGTINRHGVAHLSHFMLTFTAPSRALGKDLSNNIGKAFEQQKNNFVGWEQEGMTNLAFRCERVSLPGRIIITSPYKEANYGLNREYPTNAVYQPVDATFLMSEDYSEKIFFELWQDLIIGHHRTFGDTTTQASVKELNYLENYACSMTIHAFSVTGGRDGLKPVYSCELREAYPRTIQDIQMDWSANDFVRLNVVFDYKYFEDRSDQEITSGATEDQGGFFNTTGIGAGLAALGGRLVNNLPAGVQRRIGGAVGAVGAVRNAAGSLSGGVAARVASKLF